MSHRNQWVVVVVLITNIWEFRAYVFVVLIVGLPGIKTINSELIFIERTTEVLAIFDWHICLNRNSSCFVIVGFC